MSFNQLSIPAKQTLWPQFKGPATITKKGEKELLEKYKWLFDWYKLHGVTAYEQVDDVQAISIENTDRYFSTISELKDPSKVHAKEIISVAQQVLSGALSLGANQDIEGVTPKQVAILILNNSIEQNIHSLKAINKKKIKKLSFEEAMKQKSLVEQDKLKKLNKDAIQNVGGMIALMETNAMFNRDKLASPTVLGFQEIERPEALVNLAIARKILIKKVQLGSYTKPFQVELEVRNLTEENVRFYIPTGQIFENKVFRQKTQNLAYIDTDFWYDLMPHQARLLTLEAMCINEAYACPDGGVGNLTIYKANHDDFHTDRRVWQFFRNQTRELRSTRQYIRNILRFDSVGYKTEKRLLLFTAASLVAIIGSILMYT